MPPKYFCNTTPVSVKCNFFWQLSSGTTRCGYLSGILCVKISKKIYEPVHEISNNVVCSTSKRLRPACAYAQTDQSLCSSLEYSMSVKLQTYHLLEVLSLKGGCTCSSESTFVKMPHRWKSHVAAHIIQVRRKPANR